MLGVLDSYLLYPFSPTSFYTEISLPEIKEFVKLDDEKNTVILDKYGVDVSNYEYGFKDDEASFKSFTKNINYFGNRAGSLMLRKKGDPADAVELGMVTINPPADLKVVSQNEHEVNLAWSYPYPGDLDVEAYIIYRKQTDSSPAQGKDEGVKFPTQEIGRMSAKNKHFVDRDIKLRNTYEYYVTAAAGDAMSLPSSPVVALIRDVTPPTAPGELQAGNVLRQGNEVLYDFSVDSGLGNALLGTEREIALRWQPSSDNIGVVGYDIYREALGADYTTMALIWAEKRNLIGCTQETFFVDRGLEFGRTYGYYVVAKDAAGNTGRSSVAVGTEKSTLTGLTVTQGSHILNLDPDFAYYQTTYQLSDVDNSVKSMMLTVQKTDPLARVAVNGIEPADGGNTIELLLNPGKNTFLIEVIPRKGLPLFIQPENMGYTLAIDRANLDTLPLLTLPESGRVLKEGDIYRAAGKFHIPDDLVWTGTADYGDGTGKTPLQLNADGTFRLEHTYPDDGRYEITVDFRYEDLGLVTDSLEVVVENVAPALKFQGIQNDEVTAREGTLLAIEGSIIDPGQDSWTLSADYGSEWGPAQIQINEDKTFTFQDVFYDYQPEYNLVFKILDDDGGERIQSVRVKVENVAPSVEAHGEATTLRGSDFTGAGSFTDPGLDRWQATVDFGDDSGPHSLSLNPDKTFELNHIFWRTGSYDIAVQVADQDGDAGRATFPVKVKDYLFALEAGPNLSLNEGETLTRSVPVRGLADKVKSIRVDYGDGTAAQDLALLPVQQTRGGEPVPIVSPEIPYAGYLPVAGRINLAHPYADNGDHTVTIKLTDVDDDTYEAVFRVEAVNVDPAVSIECGTEYRTGEKLTCEGFFSDPGSDAWTVTLDFGDGSGCKELTLENDLTFSVEHSYDAAGYYTITATITDDDGGQGQATRRVAVRNKNKGGRVVSPGLPSNVFLHSLVILEDGIELNPDFDPDCLNYTVAPDDLSEKFTVAITAGEGATVRYANGDDPVDLPLDPNTLSAEFQVDFLWDLEIEVTAGDGVTIRRYIIETISSD